MAVSDAQALLLQVSADTSKALKQLDGLSKKLSGVADDAERTSKRAAGSLDKFFGKTDPGKALDKIFDSTRFKVLDTGAARIGLFGSALESLGPAGLAAAAAVGTVAAAFAGAREAAKFADDISDTANRLHVTTDALQEYRYAIRLAGGEEKGADEALEAFNVTLGKAQAGLPKALKAFKELGFTQDQVKGFTDADTALKAVVERIAGLSDVQKDAVISQLGLDGIKPLIEDGVASMQRLRDEAHKVGVVMDADLVKRGGELNDQFETVAKVIDVQLKSALVDIGPILLGLLGIMGDLARAAGSVADAFRSVQDKTTQGLQRQLDDLKARRANGPSFVDSIKDVAVANIPLVGPALSAARAQGETKAGLDAQIASIEAELAKRQKANTAPPVTPTRELIDQSKTKTPKAGPADQTDQLDKAAQASLDAATKAAARATAQLAETIEARAEAEQKALDAERDETLDKLKAQEKDILKSKNDAHKAEQLALIKKARIEVENQHLAETELLNRQTAAAKIERAQAQVDADTELRVAGLQREEDHLNALAQLTGSTVLRAEFEREALTRAQEREAVQAQAEVDRAQAELEAAQALHDEAKIIAAQNHLRAAQAAQAALPQQQTDAEAIQRRQQELDAHPLKAWTEAARDFNREAESAGVRALDALATGLADAIVNAHSLGDVAKNVFRQMIADLLAASIKRDILGPLLSAGGALLGLPPVPAHAEGGRVQGPGTGTSDSILSWLSNDEYVVNARAARKHGALLEAINSGKPLPRFAAGGKISALPNLTAPSRVSLPANPGAAPSVSQSFDLRGAVVTEELYARMQAIGQQSAAAAVSRSARLADRQFPQRSATLQILGT